MIHVPSRLWYSFNYAAAWTVYNLAFSHRDSGWQNVPRSGPLLILANHASFLDPLAVGLAVRRQVYYMARKSLFRGAFGKYLHSVGTLPVDIDGNATAGVRAGLEVLQAGQALVVFPEGTRTEDGEMIPFMGGIALLLRRAKVPVVPVGIAGAFENWPQHRKLPRLEPPFWPHRGGVGVSVGPAIPPEEYEAKGKDGLLPFFFDRVAEQVEKAKRLTRRNG